MAKAVLESNIRTKSASSLRREGLIPAVVYGKSISPVSVSVNGKDFLRLIKGSSGKNVIITLNVKGGGKKDESLPVLAHEIQMDAMSDKMLHIDFLKIVMEEEIKTKVPVVLTGESEGVKLDGGILIQALRLLEVRCLPANIPDRIEVDVTKLHIGESIHVKDLVPPKGVVIISSPEDSVVMIAAPAKEEEVAAAAAAVEGAPVEVGAVVPGAEGSAAPAGPAVPGAKVDAKAPAEAASGSKAGAKPATGGKPASKPQK
jgi:large subunit ribosomal protein L25